MIAGPNRAGWIGVAAALALAGVVGAQTRPASAPTVAAPAVAAVDPAHVDSPEARARLSEIKVGTAWLADPVTFACTLKLRSLRSTMLEVSGTLPSAEAKAKALEIARAHSDLSVVDALTVGQVSPPKRKKEAVAELNREATTALAEPAFQAIKDLEIQAHPDGQITLLGSVASHEEKLLVSLRLRRLAGCTCVDNRLSVRAMPGHACCAVTTDKRLIIRADNPERAPSHLVTAAPATPKPPVIVAKPVKPVPAPVKIVPVSHSVKAGTETRVDPAVTRAVFDVKPAAGFVVKPVSAFPEPAKGVNVAPVSEPTKLPTMKCVLPVETTPAVPAAKVPDVSAPKAPVVLAEPRKIETPKSKPAAVAEMPCIVATPASVEGSPATASKPEPAVVEAQPVVAALEEPQTETVARAPGDNEPAPSVETPAPGSLGEWYRNRIARECGLDLECVLVTFPTHTDIAVTLRIAERSTAGRLCTKVSRIPELAPYHVKIEVASSPR